ncbi:MAG: ATP-binding protein, partial [Bacteriovoracaceae bacterium]|nr:ATP-binding protein [Bacteriovoracaceae bacterium]
MFNGYAKNQLLGVCHKILLLKEGKIENSFCEVVGYVLGPERRANVMCKLFEDLVRLKNEEDTHYHIFLGKDSDVSDMIRALKDSSWFDLIQDPDSSKREVAKKIQEAFYEKSSSPNIKSKEFSEYFISEDDFASVIDSFIDLSIYNGFGIRELIIEEVSELIKTVDYKKYQYPVQFLKLSEVFELTDIQKKLLFFYYLLESVSKFESFVKYTSLDFTERKNASSAFAKILDVSQSKIKRELRSSSKLSQAMLLEIDEKDIDLSDHICDFLQNDDEDSDIFSFFFEKSEVETSLDVKNHSLKKEEVDAFKYLLKCDRGSNYLLHGAPGTGKTEFTKSIGKKLGVDVYKIKTHDSDSSDMLKEKRSALMAAKSMLTKNAILVIDEAEEILGSGSNIFYKDKSDHKAWLNTYMEEHAINIVWITNDMTMHPSTKRRFDLAICFESFTRKQRVSALKSIQSGAELELFNDEELEVIAKDYSLDPGALNLAFQKMGALSDERVNKKNIIYTLLNSQMKLLKGREVTEKPLEKFYDPNFVNTSIDETEIISTIKRFYDGGESIRNLCVLFQGIPGTGKTEYAKYISESLEKNMNVKRASDILSPMWGGTEKQIADMFKSAERDGDILFLDECDSLFKPRGNAEYSWMVSETNELLTQMERFQGGLICATNFVENIDRAAMRRFHLKIKFEDLLSKTLPKVFETFFGKFNNGEMSKGDLKLLK